MRKFLWQPELEMFGIQRMEYLDDVFVLGGAGVWPDAQTSIEPVYFGVGSDLMIHRPKAESVAVEYRLRRAQPGARAGRGLTRAAFRGPRASLEPGPTPWSFPTMSAGTRGGEDRDPPRVRGPGADPRGI